MIKIQIYQNINFKIQQIKNNNHNKDNNNNNKQIQNKILINNN